MDFSESNKLYELAAADSKLAAELSELYRAYAGQMHNYIIELAQKYGIELGTNFFEGCEDREEKNRKHVRLRLVGLILKKKPDEMKKLYEFSRELDAQYTQEKINLAKRWGILIHYEEGKILSMWTGIL